MGRTLDKQSDNQEIFIPGSAFSLDKDSRTHSNGQINTDNETEVIKLSSAEKTEQVRPERNGVKSKTPWKSNTEGEANGTVIKESNGSTINAHDESPDNKTLEKSDSPVSTPNDSSEISSLSESPSALQDDPKTKTSTTPAAGITSEDEASSRMDTTDNSRRSKKRRWDDRGQTGNDDDSNMSDVHRLEGMILS
ncbi:15994_t:CDS:1, partial [Acaulospora morrowiae]